MAEVEEEIPKGSLTNTGTAVTTWLEWTDEDIGLGGHKSAPQSTEGP